MTCTQVASGLRVSDLTVAGAAGRLIVDSLDLRAHRGEVLALTGPSGAGKTTVLRAVLGDLPGGLARVRGRVEWDAAEIQATRPWRRRHVGVVSQDPRASLHPLLCAGSAVAETLRPLRLGRAERARRAWDSLESVGLDPAEISGRRPHQLSGGQAQRVVLARALVGDPQLLVLDEPGSALDQRSLDIALEQVRRRRDDGRTVTIMVSHDADLVADLADQVVWLGPRPSREPGIRAARVPVSARGKPVLEVRELALAQPGRSAPLLREVDLALRTGELVALLGPSGCGKTTLLRALAGLHPVDSGLATMRGEPLPWSARSRSVEARRELALVGQSPIDELNPARRVAAALLRPLRVLRGMKGEAAEAEAVRLLASVGLPADLMRRFPVELSGGQRQRVALARALAGSPAVLLADEVTSALDADTAAAIMDLLQKLRDALSLTILLATHDMTVAARSDRVLTFVDGTLQLEQTGSPGASETDDQRTEGDRR